MLFQMLLCDVTHVMVTRTLMQSCSHEMRTNHEMIYKYNYIIWLVSFGNLLTDRIADWLG
jgi:hypothetical protein